MRPERDLAREGDREVRVPGRGGDRRAAGLRALLPADRVGDDRRSRPRRPRNLRGRDAPLRDGGRRPRARAAHAAALPAARAADRDRRGRRQRRARLREVPRFSRALRRDLRPARVGLVRVRGHRVSNGWFVVNAREVQWRRRPGRGYSLPFEGSTEFPQLGISLYVLGPGEPIGMYHWESNQEDFLVLSGEALLLVEGQERPLREWDFVHCPHGTKHVILGAGEGPCVVFAVGAREEHEGGWGGYAVA